VNFLAALHGYRSSMAQSDKLLDLQLMTTADLLSTRSFSRMSNDQVSNDQVSNDDGAKTASIVFQVWQNDQLLDRSSHAPKQLMQALDAGFHLKNWQGLRWRMLVYYNRVNDRWVVVGQRMDVYAGLADSIIVESILPIIWVLPLLGILIWIIVSSGLRPLNRLARLLHERKTEELEPLKTDGYPEEISILVESTNDLLSRLSDAFEREKRFAADAAHELRTPLSVLKVNLHNIAEEMDMNNSSFQELEASVDRMGHSIEQILTLYRLTPTSFSQTLQSTDLVALIRQSIAECYPYCEVKNHQISLDYDDINMVCDPFSMGVLLRNLIENACKYTPENGTILVTLKKRTDKKSTYSVLSVEDSGPGIPEVNRDRVFDRFYRLGGDRHQSNVMGCGLGLSIVEHIVRLHGGTVTLMTSRLCGGLRVEVSFPMGQ
jgi:two-component system sensor histidine kinase QseC